MNVWGDQLLDTGNEDVISSSSTSAETSTRWICRRCVTCRLDSCEWSELRREYAEVVGERLALTSFETGATNPRTGGSMCFELDVCRLDYITDAEIQIDVRVFRQLCSW
jgi:hypothetical protein